MDFEPLRSDLYRPNSRHFLLPRQMSAFGKLLACCEGPQLGGDLTGSFQRQSQPNRRLFINHEKGSALKVR